MRRPHKFRSYIKDGGYYAIYVLALWLDEKAIRPIKIGISTDPQRRLVAVQCENPATLMLHTSWWVAGWPVAARVEKNFKIDQRVRNLRGEWFHIDPNEAIDLVDQEIKRLNTWSKTDAEMYVKMRKHYDDETKQNFAQDIARSPREH